MVVITKGLSVHLGEFEKNYLILKFSQILNYFLKLFKIKIFEFVHFITWHEYYLFRDIL